MQQLACTLRGLLRLLGCHSLHSADHEETFRSIQLNRVHAWYSHEAGAVANVSSGRRENLAGARGHPDVSPLPVVMTSVERANAQLGGEPEYDDEYLCEIPHISLLTAAMEKKLTRVDQRTVRGEMLGHRKK